MHIPLNFRNINIKREKKFHKDHFDFEEILDQEQIVIPFEVFFEKILPKEKEINVKTFKYI